MSANGHNPIRYDCEKSGCFNIMKRPKIEVFCGCFPGRISFGDIDGIVERNGLALLLEWKPAPIALNQGQRIMYERLSKNGKITVLCLAGDAQTMTVTHRSYFWDGKKSDWNESTIDGAKEFCSRWSAWTDEISAWRADYETAEKKYHKPPPDDACR